jgi:hypothetical protein
MTDQNLYSTLIEKIFFSHYKEGITAFEFAREEIAQFAAELKISLPKNVGDLIYTFRYRSELPDSIQSTAPEGLEWVIELAGRGRYRFLAAEPRIVEPNALLATIKVPDATPGIISKYALNDEQALLAILRYNRLIDIFTQVTCYSLQNHLRTFVSDLGQVETDEIYVGVDRKGVHFVFPIQAKGRRDKLNLVQMDQDYKMCADKFPDLICRPISAQFMAESVIALFEFQDTEEGLKITREKHYRLVPPDEITSEDLKRYSLPSPD